MDQCGFDRLSRRVSAAATRRGALAALLAAGVAAVRPAAGSAGEIVKGCRLPGQRCDGDKKCCSGKCNNKKCQCLDRGKSCLVELAPGLAAPVKANCCSSKCSRGTKKCK